MDAIELLDLAGVAVFAATGSLAASRKQLDIIGFIFLATLTGVGGGTFRDLILGIEPVFWLRTWTYLAVCALVAVIAYAIADRIEYRYRLLLWLDAMGLSAYCVVGAKIGLDAGAPVPGAIATGIMTATLGGILRDIVSGEPCVLLRREIYVSAALIGASAYVLLAIASVPQIIAGGVAVLTAFSIRGGAIAFGWTLPGYRHRAGRPTDGGD